MPNNLGDCPHITGIGSLPYHNTDAAIAHAFSMSLPYLPQIPARYPAEYMISQALEGFPGVQMRAGGFVSVNINHWLREKDSFDEQLNAASTTLSPTALEVFEPQSHYYSCWNPFLFELQERGIQRAKIQIAGPLTCQWVVQLSDGSPISQHEKLAKQILHLVLIKALAMIKKLQSMGITPVLFLDEPGLCVLNTQSALHKIALHELRVVIQTMQKQGAMVGIHCCSNIDWLTILELKPDILSFDLALSLDSLLPEALPKIVKSGVIPSFGIIPTGQRDPQWNVLDALKNLRMKLSDHGLGHIIEKSLFTPACGLGLKSVEEGNVIQHELESILAEIS